MKQNLKQFFTSKTNWISMLTIVGSFMALNNGSMSFTDFMLISNPALLALGLRDAI